MRNESLQDTWAEVFFREVEAQLIDRHRDNIEKLLQENGTLPRERARDVLYPGLQMRIVEMTHAGLKNIFEERHEITPDNILESLKAACTDLTVKDSTANERLHIIPTNPDLPKFHDEFNTFAADWGDNPTLFEIVVTEMAQVYRLVSSRKRIAEMEEKYGQAPDFRQS